MRVILTKEVLDEWVKRNSSESSICQYDKTMFDAKKKTIKKKSGTKSK